MEDSEIKVTAVLPDQTTSISIQDKHRTLNNKLTHTKRKTYHSYHLVIALAGSAGLFAWIALFTLGMLINSLPYRKSLNSGFNWHNFIMTIITYTPSNIAILCLVSSFIGGCASLLIIAKAERALGVEEGETSKTNSHIYMSENPLSSMMRGIVVFFAFLTGIFVTSSDALAAPTTQTYTQAAGIVSMFAFLVGYDPTMFRSLISISEKIKGNK